MLDWEAGWKAGARPWPPKEQTPEQLAAHRRKMTALAHWLWNGESVPAARNTPVETYLWSRLITIPPPPSLRLHWGLRDPTTSVKFPAMLAKVEHIERGFTAVHVTRLMPDGTGLFRRGSRNTFGPIGGGAVRFGEPRPDQWLCVGEGVEVDALPGDRDRPARLGRAQRPRDYRIAAAARGSPGAHWRR